MLSVESLDELIVALLTGRALTDAKRRALVLSWCGCGVSGSARPHRS